ncbi:DUF5103 domain-containing protein [Nonlabens spongiae]|uniref:DUF5103 domain-containing protein n=1 Tax=Nonlabens spongiae TaxID=331648 RepID=A0A1W6MJU6_9FLAO|nr:DUF5103 domain-containing protein [Nonlabens spongiae]ARN77853.1 DUF5103 domain-containing protein [Nonlabens spongiae]
MKVFLIASIFSLMTLLSGAQTMDELVNDPDYIKTVTFNLDPEELLPVFELGDPITLSFDDVIGDEADYYYQFEHYDYDWTPSQLFKNEWLIGIDDARIFNYRNSFTTLQPYSHYMMRVPNQFTKGFRVSGNYMVHIYNSDRELVFSRKFMIKEPGAIIGVDTRRARDLNYIQTQQRVQFFIDSQEITFINPEQQLKVAIVKNAEINSPLMNVKPQFNVGNRQEYKYDALTSFWAGNEYLFFENKDFRSPNVNIDYVSLNDLYEAHLYVDGPRLNQEYTYFPDINGNFLVTTLENEDITVQAEYVDVHFTLDLQEVKLPEGSRIFVTGNYNAYQLQDEAEMQLNENTGRYETTILLKQGFYNYRYSVMLPDGTMDHGLISGNKWQTENVYSILAYYRELGGRYDKLIGIGQGNSENITN